MHLVIPHCNGIGNMIDCEYIKQKDGTFICLRCGDHKPFESHRNCAGPSKPSRLRGLGDVIAKATKAVGIKPCGGCKKRQEWLNKKVPFKAGGNEGRPLS